MRQRRGVLYLIGILAFNVWALILVLGVYTPVVEAATTFCRPSSGGITSPFGYRGDYHYGIDIAGADRGPVYALVQLRGSR